jgi:hypothetical protein
MHRELAPSGDALEADPRHELGATLYFRLHLLIYNAVKRETKVGF